MPAADGQMVGTTGAAWQPPLDRRHFLVHILFGSSSRFGRKLTDVDYAAAPTKSCPIAWKNLPTVLAEASPQWYQKAMCADIDSLPESGGETWC